MKRFCGAAFQILAVIIMLGTCTFRALAAVPLVFNYQAKITNNAGTPIETTVTVQFTIWDDPVLGSQLGSFSDSKQVLPVNGLFSVFLGENPGNPIPPSIFDGSTRWVEVVVDGQELKPRTPLVSVPYAIRALEADTASTADSATTAGMALDAGHAANADLATSVSGLLKLFPLDGPAYTVVDVTTDSAANGGALKTAYDRAKSLTPHGLPLSALNRSVVVVLPGRYDLGTTWVVLDTDFVDLIGLSSSRSDQYIFGTSSGQGTGVLAQSANDVRIENLTVECTRSSGGFTFSASDPAAYFPDSNKPATVVRNCDFRADDTNAYSTRRAIEYSGTYSNCSGGRIAWGGFGTASGTFTDCTGGTASFGGLGTANGTFKNCAAIDNSFAGLGGTASGTFISCTGTEGSFGGSGGVASGNFMNCTGGADSFAGLGFTGFSATASGSFMNCVGGNGAFAGISGFPIGPVTVVASGTFTGCKAGNSSFGGGSPISGSAAGGKFYYCSGGTNSFTVTGVPTVLYCVKNNVAYP